MMRVSRPAIDRDGLRRDPLDLVATHQDIGGSGEGGALAVEDADVLEQRHRILGQRRAWQRPIESIQATTWAKLS